MANRLSRYKNNFTRELSDYHGIPDNFLINMYRLNYNVFLSMFDRDYNYEGSQNMLSGYNIRENQLSYYIGFTYMLSDHDCPCDDEDEDESRYE